MRLYYGVMPLDAQDKTTMQHLEQRFRYHAPHGDQPKRYERIRAAALDFARVIVESCPSSAERSKALTDVDSAVMFANAAIARTEAESA